MSLKTRANEIIDDGTFEPMPDLFVDIVDIIEAGVAIGYRDIDVTNLTDSGGTANFKKAIGPNSENYIYRVYKGELEKLESVDTIESQTLEDTGVNVSSLSFSGSSGGTISGNILFEDPLTGYKAVYEPFNEIIPDPSVESIEVSSTDGEETTEYDTTTGVQLNISQVLQLDIEVAVLDSDNTSYTTSIVNTDVATIDGDDVITASGTAGTTTLIITADVDGTQIEVPIEVIEDELSNDSDTTSITTA